MTQIKSLTITILLIIKIVND